MSSIFCLDFGNTRLKCAVFEKGKQTNLVILKTGDVLEINELIDTYKPYGAILSSVINHNPDIETVLASRTKYFHTLTPRSKLPVQTPVGKPETIGADRLALCAASVYLYPGKHCLAIGLGTCITYNFINNAGMFLGGGISPGMHMRFRAMHEQTALLPLISAEHNFPLICYDTKTNLQSGVLMGMAKEIDGTIEAYKEKFNDLKVLMTGGDMDFFAGYLKSEILKDENLMYQGLYAIYKANEEAAV
jgi:type III pantothenate kinase